MSACWRNPEKTYTACPVLTDSAVSAYLHRGELPAELHCIEVPATKIIRNRGFWLVPSYRCHLDATVFLISTDVYEMNTDELKGQRSSIYCYFSEISGISYIGRIVSREDYARALVPLIADLHEPLALDELCYLGRVIAAS